MHAHITPFDWPQPAAPEARWPCMRHTPPSATIFMGERPFRELDARSWDGRRRIEDMDRDGVAVQALSPMPELFSYWFGETAAGQLADHVNADIARQVATAPDRFVGFGTVPLQLPALAIRHLERIRTEFGLSGVEIGSNVNGAFLGDPQFDPFFAAAAALDLPVFVHAFHPVAMPHLAVDPLFDPFVGFPLDLAMTISSLILARTLERHPRLRIGFSHGGGALAPILHRLDVGWNASAKMRERLPTLPSRSVSEMFFDSNVYDAGYLRYLCDQIAPGRVFIGTDYPYLIMQPDPLGFVSRAGLGADAMESLMSGAANRFLG